MALIPSKIGADRKKIIWLGVLVVLLVVVYIWNRNPSPPDASPAPTAVTAPNPVPLSPMPAKNPVPTPRVMTQSGSRTPEEFRPSLKLKEGMDVTRIDPTLKLELLARLRKVPFEGGSRSLFDIAAPPPPKALLANVKPIFPGGAGPGGKPGDPPPPPKPAGPPPAPPIPLKFYGFVNNSHGPKRAFFLDGEDIFMAGENELVHNRYRIIRIGVNSAVVEDTTNKNRQTLPLVEEGTSS